MFSTFRFDGLSLKMSISAVAWVSLVIFLVTWVNSRLDQWKPQSEQESDTQIWKISGPGVKILEQEQSQGLEMWLRQPLLQSWWRRFQYQNRVLYRCVRTQVFSSPTSVLVQEVGILIRILFATQIWNPIPEKILLIYLTNQCATITSFCFLKVVATCPWVILLFEKLFIRESPVTRQLHTTSV